LRQWPVQLHLVSPAAPYFQGADVVLAADCVAYAIGDFHKDHLAGHGLAIACPKLDQGLDVYQEKITALIDEAKINTLTVMTMQVPCCGGLLQVAKSAVDQASRKIPVKSKVVSLQGEILSEEWV
jgi:NADPH-dependent curcumin reductase CurA